MGPWGMEEVTVVHVLTEEPSLEKPHKRDRGKEGWGGELEIQEKEAVCNRGKNKQTY